MAACAALAARETGAVVVLQPDMRWGRCDIKSTNLLGNVLAMQAAKEAGNLIDLDSNPTKLIEVVEIGKQLLMTRGALTTFSIANDVAKYFAIIPVLFYGIFPQLSVLNLPLRDRQAPIGGALLRARFDPATAPPSGNESTAACGDGACVAHVRATSKKSGLWRCASRLGLPVSILAVCTSKVKLDLDASSLSRTTMPVGWSKRP